MGEEAVMGDTHNDTHRAPLDWRKSGRCDSSACVEVAVDEDRIGVRDGKDPNGAVLWFSLEEWTAFMDGISHGDFRG